MGVYILYDLQYSGCKIMHCKNFFKIGDLRLNTQYVAQIPLNPT